MIKLETAVCSPYWFMLYITVVECLGNQLVKLHKYTLVKLCTVTYCISYHIFPD